MKNSYRRTVGASYLGYIVQAVINNFVPLLFVTFQTDFNIPISKITALISINFLIQLFVDMLSAGFIKKVGYKAAAISANACCAAGLILLSVLPYVLPDAFSGILICVCIYALGGGLLEVIISPIVEACPTKNKEKMMSLLHSFYCWGHVGVVLLSTAFFFSFGIKNWRILSLIWALLPLADIVMFIKAPVFVLDGDGGDGFSISELFKKKEFWLLAVMMLCTGASEQAQSQWASTFAEEGLKVSKTVGDLAGPMAFAVLMGLSRLIYGKCGDRLNLNRFIIFSSILCIGAYLCASLSPNPIFALAGCGVCGFSVGIFWPGTYSIAAKRVRGGGTAMFALLALAGDLGCAAGPVLAGAVADSAGSLRTGVLAAIVFPTVMFVCAIISKKTDKSK